jgi:hypothetical protein
VGAGSGGLNTNALHVEKADHSEFTLSAVDIFRTSGSVTAVGSNGAETSITPSHDNSHVFFGSLFVGVTSVDIILGGLGSSVPQLGIDNIVWS